MQQKDQTLAHCPACKSEIDSDSNKRCFGTGPLLCAGDESVLSLIMDLNNT